MSVDAALLANEISTAMGYPTTSVQLVGFAEGILEELTTAGSATYGTVASPHPISGLVGSSMASLIKDYGGFPLVSSKLTGFCSGVVTSIHSDAIVTYTSPIPNPPAIPPEEAWFLGGTISGLAGSSMAERVRAQMGYSTVSDKLLAMCGAICSHINDNAEVESGVIS